MEWDGSKGTSSIMGWDKQTVRGAKGRQIGGDGTGWVYLGRPRPDTRGMKEEQQSAATRSSLEGNSLTTTLAPSTILVMPTDTLPPTRRWMSGGNNFSSTFLRALSRLKVGERAPRGWLAAAWARSSMVAVRVGRGMPARMPTDSSAPAEAPRSRCWSRWGANLGQGLGGVT